ncbi:MAG TPA: zinc-dependent metalloprotease, partial [Bacteroidia bacterium]|nr:zinc-dependent metalloprotease [Bacteroidia bacterium]
AIAPVYSPMAKRQVIHIGPYNNEDVTKLQSKPGSPYVFYLNHSAVMNGTTPKNNRSKEEMYRVWQCTADQYSMFNLNVTTDPAVYNAAKSADVLKTGNIKFVDADGRSNACVACFGTTAAGTLYRDPSNNDYGYGIGMTCAHEMGHQMGMSHDGGSAQSDPEYFYGLPAVQWCPIMGNYWYGGNWANQLFTWSKGEYNTATQKQDDLQIMNVNEKVPYMVDDNPSGKKMKISPAGVIAPEDNWGQIEKNTDTDAFTFEVGESGGKINLKIDPIEYLRQLDVAAKIVDANGTTVSSSNLAVNRSAEFKDLTLSGGKYSLIIQGGAELTPQTGFSNYSSLGYYAMQGTITGAIVTSIGKTTLENSVAIFPNPTEDVLNISYGFNNQNTQILLYDITGQTVYQSAQMVQTIDLSTLSKGIYFLKIVLNGESCVKKVSKL